MASTSVKHPTNRPVGEDILVISNEVHLLPDIAEEAIHAALTQIGGAVQPIGAEDTDLHLGRGALSVGVQGVEE